MDTPLSARAALLQALTVPGYGLDLIERVRRGSRGRVRLRVGSVYPALLALERGGLVRRRAVPVRHRGRPRRYYELTVAGVRAAAEQRDAILGLLASAPTEAAADIAAMRERMRACSDLSCAVLRLEGGVRAAAERR
jgi:DNA-binding PadR family transcriptional regulator